MEEKEEEVSGSPPPPSGSALCTAQYEREGGGGNFSPTPAGLYYVCRGAEWSRGGKENSADSSSSVDFSLVFGPFWCTTLR